MSLDKKKAPWGSAQSSVDELNGMLREKDLSFEYVRRRADAILSNLECIRDVKPGMLGRYRKSVRLALEEWARELSLD